MQSNATRLTIAATLLVLAGAMVAIVFAPSRHSDWNAPREGGQKQSSVHNHGKTSGIPDPARSDFTPSSGATPAARPWPPRQAPADAVAQGGSADMVEWFVANADRLATRWQRDGQGVRIKHTSLRCPVSGRKFEAREHWNPSAQSRPAMTRRELFSGEQVLVVDQAGLDEASMSSRLHALGLTIKEHIADRLYTVGVPSHASAAMTIDAINASAGSGLQARPDFIGFGGGVPDDPMFPDTWLGGWGQWNLRNSGADSPVRGSSVAGADIAATTLWDVAQSSPGVTIAVLDSGVRTNHPEFAGISWRGTNIVSTNADFSDDNGHGTAVAGIMAARQGNGIGIAGLIGPADYLIVRVLQNTISNTTWGSTSDLIKGLGYARSNGATVINLSVQGYSDTNNVPLLQSEINRCEAAGILLVVCAGNSGTNTDVAPNFPSSFTNANIISVGSHDWTDARWTGGAETNAPSNFGAASVDLFAPGARIPAPDLARTIDGEMWEYDWWTGTSFAAPHVTAVAAMIKSLNPSWTAAQIKQAILSSVATNANYAGLCVTGGRLNALGAIGRAVTGNPADDADSDGFANLIEYLAGTRADSPANRPAITAVRDSSGFSITMPRAVRPYARLTGQQSTNLQAWTTNGVAVSESNSTFRASVPPGGDAGFLRVAGVPVP